MNTPSEDIKDMLLDDSSLGFVFAGNGNLYIAKEPTLPIDCVTIFDTSGYSDEVSMDSSLVELPSIQIRIRCTNYKAGMLLGRKIKTSLYTHVQETWGGAYYTSIVCVNGPFLIDWDENGNSKIVLNWNIQRR